MGTWETDLGGVVEFPDGRRVRGRPLLARPDHAASPEFGIYLTARRHDEPWWESRWVRWPDFRLPHSPSEPLDALTEAFDRAATERVEIACGGGVGRTGTAIAILARFAGVPAEEAVHWTRAHYRPRAVETPWQRRFVRRLDIDPTR